MNLPITFISVSCIAYTSHLTIFSNTNEEYKFVSGLSNLDNLT